VSRDSSVDIATCYGLDSPKIESRLRWYISHPSRPALGPTQLPTQCATGHSQGVKRPGSDVDHPPLSTAKVKGRVELYLHSASGSSWPVLGWILPFTEFYNLWLFSHMGLTNKPKITGVFLCHKEVSGPCIKWGKRVGPNGSWDDNCLATGSDCNSSAFGRRMDEMRNSSGVRQHG
jgi:hypothetical protein